MSIRKFSLSLLYGCGLLCASGSMLAASHDVVSGDNANQQSITQQSVGRVTSQSGYSLNTTSQTKPAQLVCGDQVESRLERTRLSLGSNELVLLPLSRVRVCRESVTLEAGSVQFNVRSALTVEAGELHFTPQGPSTRGKISVASNRQVNAAVASGRLLATKADGSRVSELTDGQNVTLQPLAKSPDRETKIIGCIEKRDHAYYVRDENSNLTFEVRGDHVTDNQRHRAKIEGELYPSASAKLAFYLQAASVEVLGKSCVVAGFTLLQTASVMSGVAVSGTVLAVATVAGASPSASPSGLPQ